PVRIGVNLSARQFQKADLLDTVNRVLAEIGLPPASLELELTESILMQREGAIVTMLNAFASTGIQLTLDDFGTGYSSLSYLKQFPISKLKVDQSFVRNITTDPNDAVITSTIIGMAHNLRLKAIAEGVETAEQLAYLQSLGCDQIQGYLFSRPLPADEATTLLRDGKRL
ncbi:MAG: EAL domain-containing protein, partial [Nitrospiria bacterium]